MCGNEFTAKTTVTRFCSKKCNSKLHKLKLKQLKIQASNQETKTRIAAPIEKLNAKPFLSINDACELLGVSRMTLHRQVKTRKLKLKRIGRRVIIRRADLEKHFLI